MGPRGGVERRAFHSLVLDGLQQHRNAISLREHRVDSVLAALWTVSAPLIENCLAYRGFIERRQRIDCGRFHFRRRMRLDHLLKHRLRSLEAAASQRSDG